MSSNTATGVTAVPSASAVRRNTALLAVSMALAFAGFQHIPTLGSLMAARITGGDAAAGIPVAAGVLGIALGTYPAGRLMDRVGRRPVLIGGQLIGLAGAFVVGLSVLESLFAGVVVGCGIVGVGAGISLLARLGAVDMYSPAHRAQAVGYAIMGIAIGAVAGPLLTATIASAAESAGGDPLALPWLVTPVLFAGGALTVFLVRPDPRVIAQSLAASSVSDRVAASGSNAAPQSALLATVVTASVQAAMVAMMAVMPLAMARTGGDLAMVSTMMAVHYLGMYGLAVPVGKLCDRIGREVVLGAGALLTAAGAVTAGVSTTAPLMILGLFLVGLGWSCSYLAGTALVSDAASPEKRGRMLGRFDLIAWLAAAVAVVGAGPLLAAAGLVALAIACAGLALTALGWMWTIRRLSTVTA